MPPQSPQSHGLYPATKHGCEPAVSYVLFQGVHGVARPAHSCAVSVESPLSLPIANNFLRLIAPVASSGTAVVLMALSMATLAVHTGAPWPVLDLVGKPFQPAKGSLLFIGSLWQGSCSPRAAFQIPRYTWYPRTIASMLKVSMTSRSTSVKTAAFHAHGVWLTESPSSAKIVSGKCTIRENVAPRKYSAIR